MIGVFGVIRLNIISPHTILVSYLWNALRNYTGRITFHPKNNLAI